LHFDTMPAADTVDFLGALFKEHLGGRRLLGVLPDGTTASWASFPTVSNQRWHHRNIVLAGDSARTAHFSLGQGTKMGMEDAIVLAGSLAREVPLGAALAGYEAQRKAELVRPLSEARCSAEWFENVPRYIGRKPHQFARLLQSRWSPLVRLLPPPVSYQLRQAKDRFAVIHGLADHVGPAAKRLYGRRKPAAPAGAKATLR
jgi:2-polyprenyl-6-methoxyphenol hydroxylase-like FAD-dependent oxidoreductase